MGASGGFDALAWDGIFSIFVTLGCITLAWVLLREIRFDRIVRHPHSPRARLLQMIMAIALGHLLAQFVLSYWNWAGSIRWFFNSVSF